MDDMVASGFSNGRQFDAVGYFKASVKLEWLKLYLWLSEGLVDSISRLIAIGLEAGGGNANYKVVQGGK